MERTNIDNLSVDEIYRCIEVFTLRNKIQKLLGGCPPEELRVEDKTNCFHCDECWIAALKNKLSMKE